MKSLGINILLIAMVLICSFAQQKENIIIWDKNRKLTIADFSGDTTMNIPEKDSFCAITSSGIGMQYQIENGSLKYHLYAFFDKDSSLMKAKCRDAYTLKHEQGHFDLTEVYARKMRRFLHKFITQQTTKDQIEKAINYLYDEEYIVQDLYDVQTAHPLNKLNQDKWNKKIERMLDSLKNYENIEGKVILGH